MASTTTVTVHPTRKPKDEGSIASVFSSLSESGTDPELPTRFADLKKEIWQDALMQSWREVLDELHSSIEEIAERGADVTRSSFHVRRALQIDIGLLFFGRLFRLYSSPSCRGPGDCHRIKSRKYGKRVF